MMMLARIGPWLVNAARIGAPKVADLFNRLKGFGYTGASNAAGLVAWVKSNKLNALTLASTAVAAGLSVLDLFENEDEAKKAVIGGDEIAKKSRQLVIDVNARTSDFLAADALTEAEEAAASGLLRWAVDVFGSVAAARLAHQNAEAFFNLNEKTVDRGFRRGWHKAA